MESDNSTSRLRFRLTFQEYDFLVTHVISEDIIDELKEHIKKWPTCYTLELDEAQRVRIVSACLTAGRSLGIVDKHGYLTSQGRQIETLTDIFSADRYWLSN